jgi:hypothetical protein
MVPLLVAVSMYPRSHIHSPLGPVLCLCHAVDIRAMMYFFNLRCRVRDMWSVHQLAVFTLLKRVVAEAILLFTNVYCVFRYIGPNVVPATCLSTMTVNTMRWNTEDDVYVSASDPLNRCLHPSHQCTRICFHIHAHFLYIVFCHAKSYAGYYIGRNNPLEEAQRVQYPLSC